MVRRETRVGLGQDCVGCDHVDNSFHPVIVLRQHQLSLCQAQGKLCWEWNRIGLISMCDLTLSCHLVRNQFWVCFTDIPWPWMLFMIDQVLGEVEPVSLRQPMERYSVTVQPHTPMFFAQIWTHLEQQQTTFTFEYMTFRPRMTYLKRETNKS